jgi:hypothetical protein
MTAAALEAPGMAIWRSALPYGALWGCAVMAMETVVQPVDAMTGEYAAFILSVGVQQVALGVCIAWTAAVVERRLSLRWLPLVAVTIAINAGAAIAWGERLCYPWIGLTVFPRHQDFASAFAYHAWTALFYGGLLLIARSFALRGERVERLLARARLERSRSEATLGEVRLQSLQGSLEPQLMRQVMADIQRRQHTDPAAAERLLDELVGFLRLAMHGLRHQASTLAAELTLVHAYRAMRTEQYGRHTSLQICADAAVEDIAFPPLLLLPLLDALAPANAPPCGALMLQRGPDGVRITLTGGSREPAGGPSLDGLTERLKIGLRALHGERADVRHDVAAQALHILIHLPRQPCRRAHHLPGESR